MVKKAPTDFTPIVFIQGYKFPKEYDIDDINYFINDLIENTL